MKESGTGYFSEMVDVLLELKTKYSEKNANEYVSNIFVSMSGKPGTFTPLDDNCEQMVCRIKEHVMKYEDKSTERSMNRIAGNLDLFQAVRTHLNDNFCGERSGFKSKGMQ